jgi:hypothetical protein
MMLHTDLSSWPVQVTRTKIIPFLSDVIFLWFVIRGHLPKLGVEAFFPNVQTVYLLRFANTVLMSVVAMHSGTSSPELGPGALSRVTSLRKYVSAVPILLVVFTRLRSV